MLELQLPVEIIEYILSFLYDAELEKYARENPTTVAALLVPKVLRSRILKCNFPISVGVNEINHSKILNPTGDDYPQIDLYGARFESEQADIKLSITGSYPYNRKAYTGSANIINTDNFKDAYTLVVESNAAGRLFLEARRDIYAYLSKYYFLSHASSNYLCNLEDTRSWYLEQVETLKPNIIRVNTDIKIKYHETDVSYYKYMSHIYACLPYIKSAANIKTRLEREYSFKNCILTHFSVISNLPGTLKVSMSEYNPDGEQILHFNVGISEVKLETPIVLSNCPYSYIFSTTSVSCSIKQVYTYVPPTLVRIMSSAPLVCGEYVYLSGILGSEMDQKAQFYAHLNGLSFRKKAYQECV